MTSLAFWMKRRQRASAQEMLERVAYRLTHQFTTTASFRDRGVLMPWQQEALTIVIRLALEVEP